MPVYFLRPVGLAGPVKIGCSRVPEERLKTYTAWSPFRLELAAKIKGDAVLERRFHARFAFLHSHGEWFKGHPDLSRVVREISEGSFDPSCLPSPEQLPRRRKQRRVNTEIDSVRLGLCHRFRRHRARHFDACGHGPEWAGFRHLGSKEAFDLAQAELVWRYLENQQKSPKAKSTIIMRRLLAERDATARTVGRPAA